MRSLDNVSVLNVAEVVRLRSARQFGKTRTLTSSATKIVGTSSATKIVGRPRVARGTLLLSIALLFVSVAPAVTAADEPDQIGSRALADYVAKPDASYRWTKLREGTVGRTSYVELILTSQTWRDIVWKHQLFVIKPSSVPPDTKHALLFITGGSWNDALQDPARELKLPREAGLFATLAEELKTPVAILLHVPQQPIFDGKREDQIIALTFENYLKTRDPEWPLLLPMVKSAVRGMDAVQEYCKQEWSLELETFTVTGASKRGWTTWLTGAADPRAVAIAPMVIDMLNMRAQQKHQLASWGDYSQQINDYTQRGLQKHFDTAAGKTLQAIVDPYSYRDVLTQPKLIILGTNDPYWPLDALNLYWNDLRGEKFILYVPNNGHGVNDYPRLVGSLAALHQHAATGKALPELSWKFTNGGDRLSLRMTSDLKPKYVQAWTAAAETRDFRKSQWRSFQTRADGDGYVYDLTIPAAGYAALFGEAVFEDGGLPYYLSTNVNIVSAAAE